MSAIHPDWPKWLRHSFQNYFIGALPTLTVLIPEASRQDGLTKWVEVRTYGNSFMLHTANQWEVLLSVDILSVTNHDPASSVDEPLEQASLVASKMKCTIPVLDANGDLQWCMSFDTDSELELRELGRRSKELTVYDYSVVCSYRGYIDS